MIKNVLLLGGSGFVGTWIANRLSKAGVNVTIPTRRRERNKANIMLPQVEVVEANINDEAQLVELMRGQDAVINLVGILHDHDSQIPYGKGFGAAHVELPKKIVAACRTAGVSRLVHISALGADVNGPSEYQRSKAAGEAAIRSTGADLAWTILRPSVIFGRGDSFLNLFADLARSVPVLPLAGAGARFQPVYVEDVAEVVWRCLQDPGAAGQIFELAGPTVYTLRQLVEYVSAQVGCPRPVIPLPEALAMIQATLMEFAPQPLMSRDNVRSMRTDNVASGLPLPFGLHPTPLEAVVPTWLGTKSSRARYYPFRRHARR